MHNLSGTRRRSFSAARAALNTLAAEAAAGPALLRPRRRGEAASRPARAAAAARRPSPRRPWPLRRAHAGAPALHSRPPQPLPNPFHHPQRTPFWAELRGTSRPRGPARPATRVWDGRPHRPMLLYARGAVCEGRGPRGLAAGRAPPSPGSPSRARRRPTARPSSVWPALPPTAGCPAARAPDAPHPVARALRPQRGSHPLAALTAPGPRAPRPPAGRYRLLEPRRRRPQAPAAAVAPPPLCRPLARDRC